MFILHKMTNSMKHTLTEIYVFIWNVFNIMNILTKQNENISRLWACGMCARMFLYLKQINV
jgi:hypothetical protein